MYQALPFFIEKLGRARLGFHSENHKCYNAYSLCEHSQMLLLHPFTLGRIQCDIHCSCPICFRLAKKQREELKGGQWIEEVGGRSSPEPHNNRVFATVAPQVISYCNKLGSVCIRREEGIRKVEHVFIALKESLGQRDVAVTTFVFTRLTLSKDKVTAASSTGTSKCSQTENSYQSQMNVAEKHPGKWFSYH